MSVRIDLYLFLRREIREASDDQVGVYHLEHRGYYPNDLVRNPSGEDVAQIAVTTKTDPELRESYVTVDRRADRYRLGKRYEYVDRTRVALGVYVAQEPWSSFGH